MAAVTHKALRKPLLFLAVLVVVVVVAFDLLTPGSVIRSLWRGSTHQETQMERARDEVIRGIENRR